MLRGIFKKSEQIKIFHIHHSSVVIEWKGKMIYIDPDDAPQSFASYPPPDLVLITDIRSEYFHKEALRHIDLSRADLVAPKAVIDAITVETKIMASKALGHGDAVELHGIGIKGLPTYRKTEAGELSVNDMGNGYMLAIRNKQIYFSGDTEKFPEGHELKRIDIAFICLNANHESGIQKSVSAVLDIRPKLVYPYLCHESREGSKHVRLFKSMINQQNEHVEVRLRDLHLGD